MTLGACKSCGELVYDVLIVHQAGPKEGQPRKLGRMLDTGTQVEFMLSDGSECAVTMCLACADALTPETYHVLWEKIANASPDVEGGRRYLLSKYPVAVVRRRRVPEPGKVEIDRR